MNKQTIFKKLMSSQPTNTFEELSKFPAETLTFLTPYLIYPQTKCLISSPTYEEKKKQALCSTYRENVEMLGLNEVVYKKMDLDNDNWHIEFHIANGKVNSQGLLLVSVTGSGSAAVIGENGQETGRHPSFDCIHALFIY